MSGPDTTDAVRAAAIAEVIARTLERVHGTLDDDGVAAVAAMSDLGWCGFAALTETPGVPTYAVRANVIVLLRKRVAAQPLATVTDLFAGSDRS